MKFVFICSPFSAPTPEGISQNIEKARRYCRQALDVDLVPFAPHLHFPQFLDDTNPAQRRTGLLAGLRFMAWCCEVWVFGAPSTGMRFEIAFAKSMGIPIVHFTSEGEPISLEESNA